MEKEPKKKRNWKLIGRVTFWLLLFLVGFFLGINFSSAFYSFMFALERVLLWVIPALLVIAVLAFIMYMRLNHSKEETVETPEDDSDDSKEEDIK